MAKRSKKSRLYNKIIFEESLEGYHKGFSHRDHRSKNIKSGKFKKANIKNYKSEEEKEKEWRKLKQEINIIIR